ncbi:hypothetical protein, conserved [Babesia bigemina]|uniref:Mediator of RNA polymerase II transcription subunit 18 n=1 Tax=Babesia bigemina TaxID=5866 RepID=A0A061D763_BABBI|nr:hypothetical protein, conserved [Babesia bigemina]CDR95797.1 hypothetical protein, conserved [Babesia bigemina]|eukprot:XP_012767983.1 hypothetical protein, conserved [Babesia bigemina]
MIPYRAANEFGGWRPGAEPPDTDSEAELEAFYRECMSAASGDAAAASSKKRYEYVVFGIFRDPSVHVPETAEPEPEAAQANPPSRMSDPIYQSPLCQEFLDTLSHLMETQRVEARHLLAYRRDGERHARASLNFTSKEATVKSSSVKVNVHKPPSPLAGQCTMVEANEKPVVSSADVVVRPIGGAVNADILTVLPLCGYRVVSRMFICGHVFTSNYGNPSQVEVAVLRHYADCNPNTPVSPDSLLVEVRCVGDGDPETYKARLREYTQLLYKYVDFSLQ